MRRNYVFSTILICFAWCLVTVTVTAIAADGGSVGSASSAAALSAISQMGPVVDQGTGLVGNGLSGNAQPNVSENGEVGAEQLKGLCLENERKTILNTREALANQRYNQGNQWQKLELDSFRSLIFAQVKDLRTLRAQKDRMIDQRTQLLAFINGDGSPNSRAKFKDTLYRCEQTTQMVHLLQSSVPSFDTKNFSADAGSLSATMLKSDATLADPPILLLGQISGDPVAVGKQHVEASWTMAVEKLRSGEKLAGQDYRRLTAALENWNAAASDAINLGEPLDRLAAKAYLKRAEGLFSKLKNPEQAEKLRQQVAGQYFAGGTVAELVHFILERGISVRYGSPAQLTLRQLGNDLLHDLDGKIAGTEQGIDTLISQNPSHAATLRQSLGGEKAGQPVNEAVGATLDRPAGQNLLLAKMPRELVASNTLPVAAANQTQRADSPLADRLPFLARPSASGPTLSGPVLPSLPGNLPFARFGE